MLFLIGTYSYGQFAENQMRGERLLQKARSLNYPKLNSWIDRSIKKNGYDVVADPKFQEVLTKNVKMVMRNQTLRRKPKLEMDSGLPRMQFPVWLGGISYSANFAKPADQSAPGAGGSPGSLGGNTQTLLINNMLMLDQNNFLNLIYMRFIQPPTLPNVGGSGVGPSVKLPTDIWGGGYNYNFSDNWSFNSQLSYSDANGPEDPSLSLSWKNREQTGFFDSSVASLSMGASAPLSENSKKSGKSTTATFKASYSESSRKSSFFVSGSFAYSTYNKEETADSILANLGINLGGAPPIPGDPSQGMPDITQLPSIDLNLLSREVTKTAFSAGTSYNFNRNFSLGSNLTATYSYLESTYSVWSTSIKFIQTSYKLGQWRIGGSLGTTSPTAENMQFPQNYAVTISLSYNFGKSPPGMGGPSTGEMGPGGLLN